ncbi:NTF2-like domain containing protein [Trema orientale]|uniref:NTF2-like domain containing protein n=1 Tax=Trema orientale TaxID=63057 RepID=A0A2P5FHQ5_TREOI|nr:NTF2-like domain containing protein [Trema orientale]
MATTFSFCSNVSHLNSLNHSLIRQPNPRRILHRFRCAGENPTTSSATDGDEGSEPENALLKVAWNASELLGIATSFFRSPTNPGASEVARELARDGSGSVDRAGVVKTIKDDFERSYFVTGNLTLDAYEEDCEFADPASSFKGLRRFKRNCTNFGSLLEKSNMKLMKWEDFEDKGIGHWRFSCILSFPWKPILSASGYTEYLYDPQSGKVCRHVEHWNVPKMALLKQILRPSRRFWSKRTVI